MMMCCYAFLLGEMTQGSNPNLKVRSHRPTSSLSQSYQIYGYKSLFYTEQQCWKQWFYICAEELLLVCEITLSVMWKADFLTQQLHTNTTGTQRRACVCACYLIKMDFSVIEFRWSISHICQQHVLCVCSPISCCDIFQTNHHIGFKSAEENLAGSTERLSVAVSLRCRRGVAWLQCRASAAFRRVERGLTGCFAATDCWEWKALQCWSTNRAVTALRPCTHSFASTSYLACRGTAALNNTPSFFFDLVLVH